MTIETEREDDGRWLSEVMEIPSAMAYGQTREESIKHVRALVEDLVDLKVIANRRDEPTIPHEKFKAEIR